MKQEAHAVKTRLSSFGLLFYSGRLRVRVQNQVFPKLAEGFPFSSLSLTSDSPPVDSAAACGRHLRPPNGACGLHVFVQRLSFKLHFVLLSVALHSY